MPYIKNERREIIDDIGDNQVKGGDVVYFWYKKLVDLWKNNPSFQLYYDMYRFCHNTEEGYIQESVHSMAVAYDKTSSVFHSRQALKIALAELKRRYVDPYEDEAMKRNGDVV